MFSNFDFSVIPLSLPYIWQGLLYSLQLTATAMIGGIIIGTLLALARLSGGKWMGGAAKVYVDLMRSVPLLLMILWFFLLAPFFLKITPETSALITFTLFQAAFYSEIMRAGIQSIPSGQINAGYAIGMSYWQTMRLNIIPQSVRRLIPPVGNEFIMVLKDASLVSIIALSDLTKVTRSISSSAVTALVYIPAMIIYLIITAIFTVVFNKLERKFSVYE
ncbi:MAG: amino acid ABC transporter permease [Clostridiales bacterium]|nr:amino acid ABC transporter permease [Clostridiales bacterium]